MTCPVYYSRVSSYEESILRDSLQQLLTSAADGCGSLKGKRILLKPNLLFCRRSDDPAAVHPAVITAAAEALLNAGAAEVTLLENPGTQHVSAIIEKMQISEKLRSLNVRYDDFADYRELDLPENCCFRRLRIAREFENFDLVVDLAKAKTHAMMTLTLAVKNLFGFIDSADRLSWHLAVGSDFNRFADLLLDLYLTVKPQISIIDGIIGMEGNGPGSGTPVAANFLACSTDALALDASVAERLGVLSSELIPFKLPDPPGLLNAWGVTLPPFFKKQLRNLAGSRPVLDVGECISCGRCAEVCPPRSLKMKLHKDRKLPVFDLNNCIRCYCCQEHCPRGAISTRPQLLNSLLSAAVRIFRRR